jgi:hypothetical protein
MVLSCETGAGSISGRRLKIIMTALMTWMLRYVTKYRIRDVGTWSAIEALAKTISHFGMEQAHGEKDRARDRHRAFPG